MIDYIMIQKRWKSCVQSSRSFPSADFGNTDHNLLLAKIKLKMKAQTIKKSSRTKFDIKKFNNVDTLEEYQMVIGGRFAPLLVEDQDVNDFVENLNSAIVDRQDRSRRAETTKKAVDKRKHPRSYRSKKSY